MNIRSLSLQVSSVGSVSAEYIIPEKANCIMTLAHGAGAGMNHSFMYNKLSEYEKYIRNSNFVY